MSLSARARKKHVERAGELLGVPVATVVPVRAGFHPALTLALVLVLFVVGAILTTAILGATLFPGILVAAILGSAISRPQAIAVCPQGYALLDLSFATGRARRVRALLAFDQLVPDRKVVAHVRHLAGTEVVWVPVREVANLQPVTGVPGFTSA
jgi:hypothetical protein